MKLILLLLVFVLIVWVMYEVFHFSQLLYTGAQVSREAEAFERVSGSGVDILVVGDSTAVGTGAQKPSESVAGRLAAQFSGSTVINQGRNGWTTRELLAYLNTYTPAGKFDLLLIQIGGNDVLRFSNQILLEKDIADVLSRGKEIAETVVLMPSGNVGNAPAFTPLFERIYTWRTQKVRAILMEQARIAEVPYVDLYASKEDDPFLKDPEKYFARDGLHPSGDGYGEWFTTLMSVLRTQTSITQ